MKTTIHPAQDGHFVAGLAQVGAIFGGTAALPATTASNDVLSGPVGRDGLAGGDGHDAPVGGRGSATLSGGAVGSVISAGTRSPWRRGE